MIFTIPVLYLESRHVGGIPTRNAMSAVALEGYNSLESRTMTIERNREEILRIAARHGARNVRVFGSVARGEDRFDSDVDLLVEMQDDRSLLDLVGLNRSSRSFSNARLTF